MNELKIRKALRAFFIPFATIMLKNKVTASVLIEEIKMAFVTAARNDFGRNDKPASINRISTLTGLSRRHISNLVNSAADEEARPTKTETYESTILSNWTNLSDYVDEFGTPRALDIGPGPGTFDELVQLVTNQNRTQYYLQRLLSSNSISANDNGTVTIKSRAVMNRTDLAELIELYMLPVAVSIRRMFEKPSEDGFVLRVAHSTRVDPKQLGVVRRLNRERVISFIEDVDDGLTNLETNSGDKPTNEDGRNVSRLGVVAFYFELEDVPPYRAQ